MLFILVFAEVPVVETEEVRPGVMLDFDARGRIVAIEVLEASERTSEKIDVPEAEDDILICRLSANVQRQPIDADLLRSLTSSMRPQLEDAATLVRAMRNGDRY